MSADQGTRWETAVVKYGRSLGLSLIRAVQRGRQDVGDIHGLPDAVLQAKDAQGHRLAEWVDDAGRQAVAAGVPWGIVALKRRRGKGSSGSVADSYALMKLSTLFEIFTDLAEGREAIAELEELAECDEKLASEGWREGVADLAELWEDEDDG